MGQDARVIPREMAAEWLKLAEVFASVMRLKGSGFISEANQPLK
jgi:hypothetical protein